MVRPLRNAASLLLMIAMSAAPIAADWCAAHCEQMRLSSSDDAPPCHHTHSTAPHVGAASRLCLHDQAIVATADADRCPDRFASAPPTLSAAAAAHPVPAPRVAAAGRGSPSISLLPPDRAHTRSSNLRI